jgi:hypothetical protein
MSYDGARYVGEFRRGKYHGKGVYERPNGSKYVGEFAHGKFDGTGSFVTSTGKKYEGAFTNGRRALRSTTEEVVEGPVVESKSEDEL